MVKDCFLGSQTSSQLGGALFRLPKVRLFTYSWPILLWDPLKKESMIAALKLVAEEVGYGGGAKRGNIGELGKERS